MAYFQRIKWIVSLFFLLLSYYVKAQNNETSFIHLDRPFYVVGDEVGFKIYLLGNELVSSTIIHAELVSPEGKTLLHQNLKVTNKMVSGNFNIPLDWQEGQYLFRAYTLWQNDSLNMPKAVITKKIIPIYNDLIDAKPSNSKAVSAVEPLNLPTVIGDYNITCDEKKVFKRREAITLTLTVKDLQNKPIEADLSVAVLENTPLSKNDLLESFQEAQADLSDKSFKNDVLMPEKELTVMGKVIDTKNLKPITEQYLALYLPESKQFRRLASKEGLFKTTLPFFDSTSNIQVLSLNPNMSYPLDIETMEKLDLPAYKGGGAPIHTPEIDKYLQLNRVRRHTTDIFNLSISESFTQDSVAAKDFYVADKSYDIKNFTNISTIEDFANEVIYTSIILTKNDKKTLRLQNADTKTLYNFAPWYLVDGLFAGDEEEVLNIPINEVARIDIFNKKKTIEKYFDKLMFRYGVVCITTKKNMRPLPLISVKKSSIEGFTSPKSWRETADIDNKTPNFQPLLTWQPHIKTNKNGSIALSFRAGDIKGTFAVRIVGMTTDGKPISGVFLIEVQ